MIFWGQWKLKGSTDHKLRVNGSKISINKVKKSSHEATENWVESLPSLQIHIILNIYFM